MRAEDRSGVERESEAKPAGARKPFYQDIISCVLYNLMPAFPPGLRASHIFILFRASQTRRRRACFGLWAWSTTRTWSKSCFSKDTARAATVPSRFILVFPSRERWVWEKGECVGCKTILVREGANFGMRTAGSDKHGNPTPCHSQQDDGCYHSSRT